MPEIPQAAIDAAAKAMNDADEVWAYNPRGDEDYYETIMPRLAKLALEAALPPLAHPVLDRSLAIEKAMAFLLEDAEPIVAYTAGESAVADYTGADKARARHKATLLVDTILGTLATQTQPQDLQARIATAVRSRLDFHAETDTRFDEDQVAFAVMQVLRKEKIL